MIIILIIINIIGVVYILSKPFPFISMHYATSDFNDREMHSNVNLTGEFGADDEKSVPASNIFFVDLAYNHELGSTPIFIV